MDQCLGQNYKLCNKITHIGISKQIKSPFRRRVDGLSQKKFDSKKYKEIDKVLYDYNYI